MFFLEFIQKKKKEKKEKYFRKLNSKYDAYTYTYVHMCI